MRVATWRNTAPLHVLSRSKVLSRPNGCNGWTLTEVCLHLVNCPTSLHQDFPNREQRVSSLVLLVHETYWCFWLTKPIGNFVSGEQEGLCCELLPTIANIMLVLRFHSAQRWYKYVNLKLYQKCSAVKLFSCLLHRGSEMTKQVVTGRLFFLFGQTTTFPSVILICQYIATYQP